MAAHGNRPYCPGIGKRTNNIEIWNMRKFFDIMARDIMAEHFTAGEWIVYGVVVPLGMVTVALAFAAVVEML